MSIDIPSGGTISQGTTSFWDNLNPNNWFQTPAGNQPSGGYFTPDTLFPFYNHSQRVCNTPIDNLPPDLPEVNITTDCEETFKNG